MRVLLLILICVSLICPIKGHSALLDNSGGAKEEVYKIKARSANLAVYLEQEHRALFDSIWANPNATSQQILDEFGTNAKDLFEVSYMIQAVLQKTIPSYVWLNPPVEYTMNEDGTVTVGESEPGS